MVVVGGSDGALVSGLAALRPRKKPSRKPSLQTLVCRAKPSLQTLTLCHERRKENNMEDEVEQHGGGGSRSSEEAPATPPTLGSDVVWCERARVSGRVTIGHRVILHPTCEVRALADASITLGDGCVVEEQCLIEACEGQDMVVGVGNLFQVGCVVRAEQIGDSNTFGVKARVESGVGVGSGCEIGARVILDNGTCIAVSASSRHSFAPLPPPLLLSHNVRTCACVLVSQSLIHGCCQLPTH